jgi:hypothetical protein
MEHILTESESLRLGLRVWMKAYHTTSMSFLGKHMKNFLEEAFKRATLYWLKDLERKHGIVTPPGKDLKEALENYIITGIKGHVYRGKEDFSILQESPGKLRIKVHFCPYKDVSKDLLAEGFLPSQIPCPRMGCFRGAAEILSPIKKLEYSMIKVDPPRECEGVIFACPHLKELSADINRLKKGLTECGPLLSEKERENLCSELTSLIAELKKAN